ncbi:MAG: extracellular solute-binding protein [Candidatus Promineofilum sp.]|nr:extracellular solute-binding protein [Promineifilum sp.]
METVVVEREKEVVVTQEVLVTQAPIVVTATPEPAPELATRIRIASLSEGTGQSFEELVIKPFAKEMGVEIEVEQGLYGSQDEWLSSVRAAPGEYCIATYLSDFGLYNGISQGLLQPFRLENMPNYANLDDRWENRELVTGDTNAYVATIDIGMYTFVYAREQFDERPTSYAPLFDPAYAGRIALRDYGLYRVFQTAAYLGLDPNNMSEEDVDLVFETMAEQQKLARAYWSSSSQLDQLLANREVWLADYWFDTITRVGEDGTNKLDQLDIGWWFPEEGGPLWAGGPAIAAGCEGLERETAEMILNYMLRPDVFVRYVSSQGYIPTLETDLYDDAAFFAGAPYRAAYRDAILNTGILLDVGQVLSQQEAWNERYEELKLGN